MALWRIRATVDDRPGYLSVLTASLALRAVNILAVQVHTTEAGAVDDFLVDAPDALTETDLLAAVARGRGRDAFVSRAAARGLVDPPTRALALAGRLVADPDLLGDVLAELLDAADVTWRPAAGPPGCTGTRMVLADPGGGAYELTRAAPDFTPAEYARAQALVETARAVRREHAERVTVQLPDGAELLVRPATAGDADEVRRLHDRHRATPLDDGRLRRLLWPAGGVTLVAVDPDGGVAATAVLASEGELGQVALLVDGERRRRGIGTALLRRVRGYAERSGLAALCAFVPVADPAVPRLLRRLDAAARWDADGGLCTVTVPIAASRSAVPARDDPLGNREGGACQRSQTPTSR